MTTLPQACAEIQQRCEKMQRRCENATPGPWRSCKSIHGKQYRYVEIDKADEYTTCELKPSDADFIAHAREDIPYLLRALAALEAENLTLRNAGVNLLTRAEAAEAENQRMREALEPFAWLADCMLEDDGWSDSDELEVLSESGHLLHRFKVADLRRAATARTPAAPTGQGEAR